MESKVLVGYSSKYGATVEIAGKISERCGNPVCRVDVDTGEKRKRRDAVQRFRYRQRAVHVPMAGTPRPS